MVCRWLGVTGPSQVHFHTCASHTPTHFPSLHFPSGAPQQVSARVEELLHTAFENYFMLSEDTSSGMMDGALAVRSGVPAVLRPAVQLFGASVCVCAEGCVWGGGRMRCLHLFEQSLPLTID